MEKDKVLQNTVDKIFLKRNFNWLILRVTYQNQNRQYLSEYLLIIQVRYTWSSVSFKPCSGGFGHASHPAMIAAGGTLSHLDQEIIPSDIYSQVSYVKRISYSCTLTLHEYYAGLLYMCQCI